MIRIRGWWRELRAMFGHEPAGRLAHHGASDGYADDLAVMRAEELARALGAPTVQLALVDAGPVDDFFDDLDRAIESFFAAAGRELAAVHATAAARLDRALAGGRHSNAGVRMLRTRGRVTPATRWPARLDGLGSVA